MGGRGRGGGAVNVIEQFAAVVPVARAADANALAMILGEGPADAQTYSARSLWALPGGGRVHIATWRQPPDWVARAARIARPDWDQSRHVNLTGARRAALAVRSWRASGAVEDTGENAAPTLAEFIAAAPPDAILFLVGLDPDAVIAALGAVRVPPEAEGAA